MESGNLNKESRETASKTLVGAVGPPTPDLSAPEEEFTRRRKGAEGGTCGPLVREADMRKTKPIVAPQKILRAVTGNHRLSQASLQSTIPPVARLPQAVRVKRICLLHRNERTRGPRVPTADDRAGHLPGEKSKNFSTGRSFFYFPSARRKQPYRRRRITMPFPTVLKAWT